MGLKRTRELKPLSSEHHQALLVAFQLKKAIAGHAETAGAPRDLDGLLALARRYEDSVFRTHTAAEEELLGGYLAAEDMRRLTDEHSQMRRFLAGRLLRPARRPAPRPARVRRSARAARPLGGAGALPLAREAGRRRGAREPRARAREAARAGAERRRPQGLTDERGLTPPRRRPRCAPRPRPSPSPGSIPAARRVICAKSSSNGGAAPFMNRSGFTRATTKFRR